MLHHNQSVINKKKTFASRTATSADNSPQKQNPSPQSHETSSTMIVSTGLKFPTPPSLNGVESFDMPLPPPETPIILATTCDRSPSPPDLTDDSSDSDCDILIDLLANVEVNLESGPLTGILSSSSRPDSPTDPWMLDTYESLHVHTVAASDRSVWDDDDDDEYGAFTHREDLMAPEHSDSIPHYLGNDEEEDDGGDDDDDDDGYASDTTIRPFTISRTYHQNAIQWTMRSWPVALPGVAHEQPESKVTTSQWLEGRLNRTRLAVRRLRARHRYRPYEIRAPKWHLCRRVAKMSMQDTSENLS